MRRVAALFVCVHNSGRSQMAAALFNAMATERGLGLRAESAGTHPAVGVNQTVARVMIERGLGGLITRPRQLTDDLARSADRIISMGCDVDASLCPSAGPGEMEDWGLPDPAGMAEGQVRNLEMTIRERVGALLDSMGGAAGKTPP